MRNQRGAWQCLQSRVVVRCEGSRPGSGLLCRGGSLCRIGFASRKTGPYGQDRPAPVGACRISLKAKLLARRMLVNGSARILLYMLLLCLCWPHHVTWALHIAGAAEAHKGVAPHHLHVFLRPTVRLTRMGRGSVDPICLGLRPLRYLGCSDAASGGYSPDGGQVHPLHNGRLPRHVSGDDEGFRYYA